MIIPIKSQILPELQAYLGIKTMDLTVFFNWNPISLCESKDISQTLGPERSTLTSLFSSVNAGSYEICSNFVACHYFLFFFLKAEMKGMPLFYFLKQK